MRILHLLPSLERRGAQVFAATLIRALGERGVRQFLGVLGDGADQVGIDAGSLPALGVTRLRSGVRWSALRRLFDGTGAEIVLAHGGDPFRHAVLARARHRTPLIVYRKIGLSEKWLARPQRPRIWLHRWLIRRADAVVTVGDAVREELLTLFRADPRKVITIYRGVPAGPYAVPEGTREAVRTALGLAPDAGVIVAVGALRWEKNQAAMLRALVRVRRVFPDAVLLLAGEGPTRAALGKLAVELCLGDAVRFLGVRRDVPGLLAAADLALLTSLTEGVPGALIEAGLAGLTSVAWEVGGAREVVRHGDSGILVPPGDEDATAAAIIALLRDPQRRRTLGAAARALCREQHDIGRCAERHVELFQGLLRDRAEG